VKNVKDVRVVKTVSDATDAINTTNATNANNAKRRDAEEIRCSPFVTCIRMSYNPELGNPKYWKESVPALRGSIILA
jgi:hypothetical protein